jgi:hypothetical protein
MRGEDAPTDQIPMQLYKNRTSITPKGFRGKFVSFLILILRLQAVSYFLSFLNSALEILRCIQLNFSLKILHFSRLLHSYISKAPC